MTAERAEDSSTMAFLAASGGDERLECEVVDRSGLAAVDLGGFGRRRRRRRRVLVRPARARWWVM